MSTFVPQGIIELIKDVDIDVSYTHQYYFSTLQEQTNFFTPKVFKQLDNGTYQRKNLGSIQVNYAMDEIANCKYLRWKNVGFSDKYYYAFVTSIDYENPKVSYINYQLDVYQTYLFDMEWKQSFVEREHCRRWNSDGSPVINLEDEGLDYGDMYDLCTNDRVKQFIDEDGDEQQVSFAIIGTTITDTGGGYKQGGIPTMVNYYAVPIARNNLQESFKMGNTALTNILSLLKAFRDDTKLVNSLVSCHITPYFPFGRLSIEKPLESSVFTISDATTVVSTTSIQGASTTLNVLNVSKNPYLTSINMGNKYDGFPQYTESKLLMFPYSFTEITTLRGDAINVKNEYITSNDLVVGLLNVLSQTNKLTIEVSNYLIRDTGSIGIWDIENSLVDLSDSTMPMVDDYTASYLQSNSNANTVAVQNARNSMTNSIANANREYNTSIANANTTALTSVFATVTDVVGDIVSTPFSKLISGNSDVGSIIGGLGELVQTTGNLMNAQRSASSSQASKRASAQTDFYNTQATILAKVKDAQQVPASARALGGNYLFDYANNTFGVYIRKKTIKQEYANKLTDFFKQYGYKVNRLEVPQFFTRANWNYIKMAEPNIYGNIPMDDLLELRDIFMKGITLWHGDYIGDYSLSNVEVINNG